MHPRKPIQPIAFNDYPKETGTNGTGISDGKTSYPNKAQPYDLHLNAGGRCRDITVTTLPLLQAITEEVPIFLLQQIYSFQLLLETNAPCHT